MECQLRGSLLTRGPHEAPPGSALLSPDPGIEGMLEKQLISETEAEGERSLPGLAGTISPQGQKDRGTSTPTGEQRPHAPGPLCADFCDPSPCAAQSGCGHLAAMWSL